MSDARQGLVVSARSRDFTVLSGGERWSALVPNRLRFEHPGVVDPVAVGDLVRFHVEHERGVILEVLPRRNVLSRSVAGKRGMRQLVAANLDQALIVLAAAEPPWKPATIDRYLVLAGAAGIPPAIVINKIDLDRAAMDSGEIAVYPALGIPLLFVSARTGEGMDALSERLAGRTSVFLGPSGGGKSSLVNRAAPGSDARVATVSASTRKGRHTTTWVEMIDLPGGGRVIDSPGLRVLDLSAVEPADLEHYFPEIEQREEACRFPDCTHRVEPGCAVQAMVERGSMAPHRYASYKRIAESLTRGDG